MDQCPFGIQGNKLLLVCRHHALGENRSLRAGRYTGVTVDAHLGIDKQHFRRFTEGLYRTDIDAAGVLIANTGLGNDVCHGLLHLFIVKTHSISDMQGAVLADSARLTFCATL